MSNCLYKVLLLIPLLSAICSCKAEETKVTIVKVEPFSINGKYVSFDSAFTIEKLNEEAKRRKDELGREFRFELSEGNPDLIIHVCQDEGSFDPNNYLPLSDGVKAIMSEAGYVKGITDYLKGSDYADRMLPCGLSFSCLAYDSTIYSKSDLATLDGVLELVSKNDRKLCIGSDFMIALLSGSPFLDIHESGKKDGQGTLIWSNSQNEDFYRTVNEKFAKNDSILPESGSEKTPFEKGWISNLFSLSEKASLSYCFYPRCEFLGKDYRPLTMGTMTGFCFDKTTSLNSEEVEGIAKILSNKDGKVSTWAKERMPVNKIVYQNDARLNGLYDEIDECLSLYYHETDKDGINAVLAFGHYLLTSNGEDVPSFCDLYTETFERYSKRN